MSLGVRAFGTQLLFASRLSAAPCAGKSYELNEEGLFNVEYADVLGIPFDFTARPVIAPPQPPRETINGPRRSPPNAIISKVRFPRVEGYRVELPRIAWKPSSTKDSIHGAHAGPGGSVEKRRNEGIIGEGVDLDSETSLATCANPR